MTNNEKGLFDVLIGYARVSTQDQKLDLQITALQAAGCDRIYEDQGFSGTKRNRPGLVAACEELRAGDTLIVWRLDRLGRSIQHLIEMVEDLKQREICFRSLHEAIDTNSSGGKLFFHMIAAMAEFERNLISERTHAGIAAARARGKVPGRPSVLSRLSPRQVEEVKTALQSGAPLSPIAQRFGVCTRTLRRWRAEMLDGEMKS